MNQILLDGKKMKKNPHKYLKKILNFPDYYGNNLDALYDCLGDINIKTCVKLINSDYINQDIIDTFKDASYENPNLKFNIIN
ncbi:MAG: barstar family protein [Methanobacteriaceae archaeon]|nr:barstar family protein [Methanobacteriaceae archaeon]